MFKSAIAYPASCCFLDALDSPVSQKQSAAIRASSSFWSLFYFNLRWAMGRVPFSDISWLTNHSAKAGSGLAYLLIKDRRLAKYAMKLSTFAGNEMVNI